MILLIMAIHMAIIAIWIWKIKITRNNKYCNMLWVLTIAINLYYIIFAGIFSIIIICLICIYSLLLYNCVSVGIEYIYTKMNRIQRD
jgi:hypothetical protein